jgi:hypothetical protein
MLYLIKEKATYFISLSGELISGFLIIFFVEMTKLMVKLFFFVWLNKK